jgi:NAD dependent epimerase/dehydratase family enzyme
MIDGTRAESALTDCSIAVSGATGLIGSAVTEELCAQGATVLRLTRCPPRDSSEIAWDPQSGVSDPERLAGLRAVVHLAGENIAAGRWTAAMKQRIRESRVVGTRALCESLARASVPPQTLVCASAIGYYGDRGDELLDESSPPGTGFLPEVCCGSAWSSAAAAERWRRCCCRFGWDWEGASARERNT